LAIENRKSKNVNRLLIVLALVIFVTGCAGTKSPFKIDISKGANPWTHLNLLNDPDQFHFAIVGDRTGEHRPGAFEDAVNMLNILRPEFVLSVGDFIEGYADDEAELDRQWVEFDTIINKLEMPFFYIPGNHDVGNRMMAQKWQQRLGRDYYHFVYRNVLFLCLNTGGPSPGWIGNEQIEYFSDVLVRHKQVRWTMVFMHQPAWLGSGSESWAKFRLLLGDRPYTVFAGHQHGYSKSIRDDAIYYVLSTTGGQGSNQIIWATMTDNGPVLANLPLDCILNDNLLP
jgi:3',5'-cyclic AMP phosphodiesterase CpdA